MRRGQALFELIVVLPLVIFVLLFGLYFSELAQAKLKLREVARFVTWEMTVRPLDDFTDAKHDRAFDDAWQQTRDDAAQRFADLDSIDERPAGNVLAGFKDLTLELQNEAVELPDVGFHFDARGRLRADVGITVESRFLHQQARTLHARFAMVASDWHLFDGGDAIMSAAAGQAGIHPDGSIHPLWLQVNRMTQLGLTREPVKGLEELMKAFAIAAPSPFTSTFVVSHNYGKSDGDPHRCASGPGSHDPGHEAKDGMNNLDQASKLDHPWRKCFDTAPFRDVTGYAGSLYVKQFEARGQYFMGCPGAQADDPLTCGGGR
jgi:hypothetical protein